jgi:2-polyprenyl-3-methyl-5-hydroxy-6-metoxy-1,4-benzoquinol methylase
MSTTVAAAPFARATDLLQWSFDNPPDADCAKAIRQTYAAYYEHAASIDYVWDHVERRTASLGEVGRRGARVLEVGSGIGSNCLWAAISGGSVTGIEVRASDNGIASKRQAHLEAALGRRLDCQFRCMNVLDFRDRDGFDIVFLQEAFHHIEPRAEAVIHLASLVRPGGALVLQETNAWNPLIQARLFRRRGFNVVRVQHEPTTGKLYSYGVERVVTPWGLNRLFRPLGFVTRTSYFRLLPTRLARMPALARIARTLERGMGQGPAFRPFYVFYEWVATRLPPG